jgi:hypothetical protein
VCAASGEVSLDVPLSFGTDHVSIVGFDANGFASNEAAVEIVDAEARAARPDLWIVAVGIGAYPHLTDAIDAPADRRRSMLDGLQLPAAPKDAEGIARRFAALAGDGKAYARAHATTLLDGAATPDAIRAALSSLRAMQPGDVAVVAMAGHGFKPSEEDDMVFVTGGAVLRPDGKGVAPPTLARESVGWRDIAGALALAQGRVLLLLDACHSGHISQELAVPNAGLADRLVESNRAGAIVFAASKGRQVSFEPRTARALVLDAAKPGASPATPAMGDHGFFTGAVLAALDSKVTDENGDGEIQVSELIEDVTRRVEQASRGQQTPWVARRDLFGDFSLAPAPP